jgi:hypothetical protein
MKRSMIPLILALFALVFVVTTAIAQTPDTVKKAEPAKATPAPAKTEPVKVEPMKIESVKIDTAKKAVSKAKIEKPAETEKPAPTGILKVEKIACGAGITDRELQGQDTTFAESIEKVYCWALITGGSEGASVNFVWSRDGKEVVKVPINVKYPRARVYSYKSKFSGWKGEWKVDVVDGSGQVLGTTAFKIK